MIRRGTLDSFDRLVHASFNQDVNAWCWPRTLSGDFDEVARALAPRDGLIDVDATALRALKLSAAGRVAAEAIEVDLKRLVALDREPVLSCITSYARDTRGLPITTDVLSFHADSAPTEMDTWLCTYAGRSSEGLEFDDAQRAVDVPAIRSELLRHHGGDDDERFRAFLTDGAFDLHYRPKPGAVPFTFGVGHLWRLAVVWPGARVPPCLHRAPPPAEGDAPRLLLIA